MTTVSRTGDEGYPGNLTVRAVYRLTEQNGLVIDYSAVTDARNIVCLTHHSYFNLSEGLTILDHQLVLAGGFDHNFVLNTSDRNHSVATLTDPLSGRKLDVFTSESGLQVYSGNYLDGSIVGKSGKKYKKYGGICLETQHFPDSPNRPCFPSVVLSPGEVYRQTTCYLFGVL